MANPTLPSSGIMMDYDDLHFEVEGIVINDKVVVTSQQSTIADVAAATAAAAAVTATSLTYAGGGSASATPGDLSDGSTYANDFGALEDNLASIITEINSLIVDVAAQKVELDKLITDRAANLTTTNAVLSALESHGLLADA